MESIPNDAQHRGPEKHGLALCQGPRQRTQEMMSLPATEPNRTRNLGIQASTADRSPQPDCSLPRASAVCPAQRPRPQQSSKGECVGMRTEPAQRRPERMLVLCPKEQKGNPGAQGRAGPQLPSHPRDPESFPCESGWVCSGYVSPQASPGGCGSQACGPGVSTPQGRAGRAGWGESRHRQLRRLTSRPQRGLHPPRGGGGVSEQTCISAHSGSRSSSGQKQQPYWPGTARQQG